jgi:acyl-CoA thioester hydrolase
MTTPSSRLHKYEFEVRDYECDIQGIVNNAHYQHYLEHARHKYLNSIGLDFATLAQRGINLVVFRIEIDYLYPLRSNDQFIIHSMIVPVSRIKIGIKQEIYRLTDQKPIVTALVTVAVMDNTGRPIRPPKELLPLFANQSI